MYEMAQMQLTVYDFVQPFGGVLDEENRWVRLAKKIDWLKLEKQYAAHFGKGGAVALPLRMAFGSLVIRAALGLSDRQTVELIREDPYLQYFIGLPAFTTEAPFSAAAMAAISPAAPPPITSTLPMLYLPFCSSLCDRTALGLFYHFCSGSVNLLWTPGNDTARPHWKG